MAVLPGGRAGGGCAWFAGDTAEPWKWELADLVAGAQARVALGLPVVVGLGAWLVACRGERAGARIWAALAVAGVVAADHVLLTVRLWLGWTPEGADCTVAPEAAHAVPAAQLVWTFAPAVLAMAGAWAAGRTPLERSHRQSWWPVWAAAALAAGTVLAASGTLRLPAGDPEQPLAPDGTPRYALVITGDRLGVLDLVAGGEPRPLPAPDPAFFQYTAITRDTRPGGYLAAVSTAGDGAFGGRSSRVYRIVMDGDGGAAVGGQVGGDLAGTVLDLAVSARGQIAYSRVVAVPADTLEVATTFVGLVAPRREWSAAGAHGAAGGNAGPLGLHWRDAGTLAFHTAAERAGRVAAAGRTGRVVALDVTRPGSDLLAARELHTLADGGDGLALSIPGGTPGGAPGDTPGSTSDGAPGGASDGSAPGGTLAVSWAAAHAWHDHRITVVEPSGQSGLSGPSGKERLVFASGQATLHAFTLDRAGRHLLVSLVTERPRGAYELVRVDLGSPEPRPRRIWQGASPVASLAW